MGEKTAQKLIAEFGSIESLLERTGELKGALKTKVEENREKIIFSKFLATIKTDVPVELDMKSLERETPNEEELTRLLDFYELRALKERVKKNITTPSLFDNDTEETKTTETAKPQKEHKSDPLQGSLFDFFADEDTYEEKKSSHLSLKEVEHTYKLIENKEDIYNLATERLKPTSSASKALVLVVSVSKHTVWCFFITVAKLYISSLFSMSL